MNFSCLGSCVCGDILTKAKQLHPDWRCVVNYVSYSPLAFRDCVDKLDDLEIDSMWSSVGQTDSKCENTCSIVGKNNANDKRIKISLTQNIYSLLNASKPDYVLVDLVDYRLNEWVINFENGKKIAIGKFLLENKSVERLAEILAKEYGCGFDIKSISVADLSDEELDIYIRAHIDKLKETIGEERLIFIKPRLTCNYLDGKAIEYAPQFHLSGSINALIDRVYRLAAQYINYIDAPDHIIGDASCLSPFAYHFSQPYYSYVISAIELITGDRDDNNVKKIEQLRHEASEEIYNSYNRIFCLQILERLRKQNRLNEHIVLIARNRQFEELLCKKICKYILYDKSSKLSDIECEIRNVQSKCDQEQLVFIVPEMFNHGEKDRSLCSVFYRCGLLQGRDWLTYIFSMEFKNLKGSFIDVYNNDVNLESDVNIKLSGIGNRIFCGKHSSKFQINVRNCANINILGSNRSFGNLVRVFDDGLLFIDKNVSAVGLEIAVHNLSTVRIGKDVMFSINCMVYANDGHSIFQYDEGTWNRINHGYDAMIKIGNHVWIGYGCHILAGAEIGDGSICGTDSLIKKKYPNNCIIAGQPARIVRENIAWSRNDTIVHLDQDAIVEELYAKKMLLLEDNNDHVKNKK